MIRISSDKDDAFYATLAGNAIAAGITGRLWTLVQFLYLSRFNRVDNLQVLDYDSRRKIFSR